MSSETRSSAATLTTMTLPYKPQTRVTLADPWDAPYFGGSVYLAYQPTLPADVAEVAAPATSVTPSPANVALSGFDPWDAPYFGGLIYLSYPAYPVTLEALNTPALVEASAEPAPQATGAISDEASVFISATIEHELRRPQQRGWLARLAGAAIWAVKARLGARRMRTLR